MASSTVTIEVTKWPEALFVIRREMANLLRREADAEADPRFAKKLMALAAEFEAGSEPPC